MKYILLCRNVVSFSDGSPDKGRGIPYFYLTTLDPTARNALKDQRSSFTISEYAIGTCGKTDPENPSCAKITLVGKVVALTTLLLLKKSPFFMCNCLLNRVLWRIPDILYPTLPGHLFHSKVQRIPSLFLSSTFSWYAL